MHHGDVSSSGKTHRWKLIARLDRQAELPVLALETEKYDSRRRHDLLIVRARSVVSLADSLVFRRL